MDRYFENKRALVASIVTLGAVGIAGYFILSGHNANQTGSCDSSPRSSKPSAAKKRKNKKKSSSKKSAVLSHGFPTTRENPESPLYPVISDWSRVSSLKENERKEIGEEFKIAGNSAFNEKNFDKSLELYTFAIKAFNKEPVFYSNRAAVWGSLRDYEKVIADTTEALKLRPDYVKCYTRRAIAYENLKNYKEAVMDYTAACILQNFEDNNVGQSVDRALKAEAERLVAENCKELSKEFPSANFVRAYLNSFHERELPLCVMDAQDEDSGEYDLKLAFDAIEKENQESYKQALDHIKRSISKGFNASNKSAAALAYEYLATFEFLCNDSENALNSINRSLQIEPTVPAYLKRSALQIESGKLEESEQDYILARQLDPNSADLYYQLAQVEFLQSQWDLAVQNYQRSIELDDSFILAHIQLAVTEYRMNKVQESKDRFQSLLKKHPEEAQVFNYYGEILLDLKEVEPALEMFDKAIALERSKSVAAINVLPLVNKALALIQSAQGAQDIENAIEICKQAEAIDPLSDVAIGTLAQFYLQQGRTNEAIELFERNARLARSTAEQVQAYTFAEAARTQFRITQERPIVRERLQMFSQMPRP